MKKNIKCIAAAAVFLALLVYELFLIGRFAWISYTRDGYQAYLTWGYPSFSVSYYLMHLLCKTVRLVALVVLAVKALKQKTSPKPVILFSILYSAGMILPWLFQRESSYVYLPYLLRQALHLLPLILVLVLWAVVLPLVIKTPGKKKKTEAEAAQNEQLNFYGDLLEKGVITKKEYDEMAEKIKEGKLQ